MQTPYGFIWITPQCFVSLPSSNSIPTIILPTSSQFCRTQNEIPPISTQNPVKPPVQSAYMVKQEYQLVEQESKQKNSRFKNAKKNVQANVVNQVISFLTTSIKSKTVLMRILRSQQKVKAFYLILGLAKRKKNKYTSRYALQTLIQLQQDHPIYVAFEKHKGKAGLKLTQIKIALFKLTNYFLRNLIVPTLLTSSKLDKSTLHHHLSRARQIHSFINSKPGT